MKFYKFLNENDESWSKAVDEKIALDDIKKNYSDALERFLSKGVTIFRGVVGISDIFSKK